MNKMDIRRFFNKPTRKSVEVSNFDTSNIYYTAADTDTAIEAVNSSVRGTCSTSTATVSSETPAAASGCVNDLGEKATGPKQPLLPFFPKHQIGDINRAFSPFYYNKFPWIEYSVSLDSVFSFCCCHFSSNIA